MSIERSLFREEEEKFKAAATVVFPASTVEGLNAALDRWWQAKLPVIEMLGDVRRCFEVDINRGVEEEELGGLLSSDLTGTMLATALLNEWRPHANVEWFCPPDMPMRFPTTVVSRIVAAWADNCNALGWIQSYPSVGSNGSFNPYLSDGHGALLPVLMEHPDVVTIRSGFEDYFNFSWAYDENNPIIVHRSLYSNDALQKDFTLRYISIREMVAQIIAVTPLSKLLEGKTITGMRLSKFLRTVLPEEYMFFEFKGNSYWDRFDRIWSIVLQKFKAADVNEKIILSVAPIDFLTLSETSSWTSCLALRGGYPLAGLTYALAGGTAVLYSPRAGQITGSERVDLTVPFDDKRWRQLAVIDITNGSAAFSREYPGNRDELYKAARFAVMRELASYRGLDSRWIKGSSHNLTYEAGSLSYSDGFKAVCRLKDVGDIPSGVYAVSDIGCLTCGAGTIRDPGRAQCVSCLGLRQPPSRNARFDNLDAPGNYTCEECGEVFGHINIHHVYCCDRVLCWGCIVDTHVVCDRCSDMNPCNATADFTIVGEETMCEGCFAQSGYMTCPACDELVHESDTIYIRDIDEYWCDHCTGRHAWLCEDCEEHYSDNGVHSYTVHSPNQEWSVCETCLERNSYAQCYMCECVFTDDAVADLVCGDNYDGIHSVCRECLDSEATLNCSHCGILVLGGQEKFLEDSKEPLCYCCWLNLARKILEEGDRDAKTKSA